MAKHSDHGIELDEKSQEQPKDKDRAQTATKAELLSFLEGKVAKWWLPDDVAFVAEIPHTATGKIQKTVLRKQFENFVLPTAAA